MTEFEEHLQYDSEREDEHLDYRYVICPLDMWIVLFHVLMPYFYAAYLYISYQRGRIFMQVYFISSMRSALRLVQNLMLTAASVCTKTLIYLYVD